MLARSGQARSQGWCRLALLAALGLLAAASLASGAQARTTVSLSLDVTFLANGQITVTFPSGSPVGAASGSPTVIPAGFYTIVETGPGGCTQVPYFELNGPGEAIHDDMTEGEVANASFNAYFQPNSTYTWRDDGNPSLVYTFVTSSQVEGTAPAQPLQGYSASVHGTAASVDPLAQATAAVRGTLLAGLGASGAVTLTYHGRPVTSLKAGRYTIALAGHAPKHGIVLEKGGRTVGVVAGTRAATVVLSAGNWLLVPRAGGKSTALAVS